MLGLDLNVRNISTAEIDPHVLGFVGTMILVEKGFFQET
jgi:hypothetical protein